MKKILLSIFLLSLMISSCGDSTNAQNNVYVQHQQPQNVNVQSNDLPGFDVNGFANLLKSTTNPDALTQALNQPNNNINNLDLDGDNNIDYLKVDQVDNNTLGIYDETQNGKVQVATLNINTQNNSYAINGTPDYCGNNYSYQSPSGLSFGQIMFLSWMMRPHAYYHPYWGYHSGYYGGYHGYHSHYAHPYTRTYIRTRTVNRPSYNNSTRTTTSRPSYTAPTPQRNSLSNPTSSQKAFSSGESNRFKNSGSNTSGFSSSRSSSSRSSFGGSRGGFGGRRR